MREDELYDEHRENMSKIEMAKEENSKKRRKLEEEQQFIIIQKRNTMQRLEEMSRQWGSSTSLYGLKETIECYEKKADFELEQAREEIELERKKLYQIEEEEENRYQVEKQHAIDEEDDDE